MPDKFTKCYKEGGRVRTIQPNKDKNIHICWPKGGGPSISGEPKKSKFAKEKERKKRRKRVHMKSSRQTIIDSIMASAGYKN